MMFPEWIVFFKDKSGRRLIVQRVYFRMAIRDPNKSGTPKLVRFHFNKLVIYMLRYIELVNRGLDCGLT